MRLVALVVACLFASLATAQPDGPGRAPPVDVPAAIERLESAYRDGPVAERVVVRVTDRSGRSTGSRVVVRLTGGASPSLRLELGDLQVFAGDGVIRAAHRAEARLYAEWPLEGPPRLSELSRRLPPILLPQLAVAFDDDPSLSRPLPPLPAVTWERVEASNRPGAPPRLTLLGAGPGIRARLTFDAQTGRLWRAAAELDEPADVARVELHCTPVEAGDPASWGIPAEDRERVDDLTLLRPRPAEIKPGEPAGDLRLFDADLTPWSPPSDARAVVLLTFRQGQGGPGQADTQADVEAGLVALAPLARDWNQAQPRRLLCRAVVVHDEQSFDREAFRALSERWSDALSLLEGGSPGQSGLLLWAGGGDRWLARFCPGYDSAIIVLAPGADGLVLAGVIPLDGRAEDPEAVTEDLREILKPA